MTPFTIDSPLQAFDIKQDEDIWIFAYGSLMWNPEFEYDEAHIAHVEGYHRRFCLKCDHYRGDPQQHGLVLGLDRGGSCRGVAYKVNKKNMRPTLEALWRREMRTPDAYTPQKISVILDTAEQQSVSACVFVSNPLSNYYFKDRCHKKTAQAIALARGVKGTNLEYLERTVKQLRQHKIQDSDLEEIYSLINAVSV